METLPRQPAEEKQGRPTMLLRKQKRLEENDKKSGKSRRVWKSLWGSYAAGTGTFLMCGHHFVQHEEDVGAHLPSLLHSGFPQKVRVNVKNVSLLCKGPKSPAFKGLSKLSYDWKCPFRQQENFWGMGDFPRSGIRNKQVSDIESGYPDIESGYPDIRI